MGFIGIDASIKISLNEYGMIAREHEKNELQVIHVTQFYDFEHPKYFDIHYISFDDLKKIMNEPWFEKKEFLSYLGITETEFLELPYIHILSDYLSYYGYENILGSSYDPWDIDDLTDFVHNESILVNE